MSNTRFLSNTRFSFRSTQSHRSALIGAACALAISTAPFAAAQIATATPVAPAAIDFTTQAHLELPDDPSASFSTSASDSDNAANPDGQASNPATVANNSSRKTSGHLQMTIAPGQITGPMSTHDKVVGGLKDSFSLFAMVGWFASAGWEQATNGSPNYGTNGGAFAARLGAAAARSSSESVFSESLFAPIFHEDPRYYVMGRGHSFIHRVIYSGTRVIITRSDSGREVPNFALLAGNAGGAALTIPYYPQKNTTFGEVAQTYGGSLGGSAIGYVVTEFLGDALVYAHLRKADQ